MTEYIDKTNKLIPGDFIWKTATDEFIQIKDMRTSHLFYTLLMIWNHSAPKHLQQWITKSKRRYSFGAFYTNEYVLQAFKCMYFELKNRSDLYTSHELVLTKIENDYLYTMFNAISLNQNDALIIEDI